MAANSFLNNGASIQCGPAMAPVTSAYAAVLTTPDSGTNQLLYFIVQTSQVLQLTKDSPAGTEFNLSLGNFNSC